MNKKINSEQANSFTSALWVSLALHSIFVSFFTLKIVFFPNNPIEYQSAVRVDLVALPDKIADKIITPEPAPVEKEKNVEKKPEPPKPEPAEIKPQVEVKPVVKENDLDTINLKKSKSKQNEALDRIKKMEAIDKIKESLKSENNEKVKTAELSKVEYKGNVLAAGTELTGLNQLQHDAYIGQIDRHVKKHWALPEWFMNKNLKVQVLFKIDSEGIVTSAQIKKGSGNSSYDELALEAVNKSSPFPKPPEKFKDIVAIRGILLGFPE